MSVFIQRLLRQHPHAHVTAVDLAPPDDLLLSLLGSSAERVNFHQLDVRDKDGQFELMSAVAPDSVVHAATLTHVPEWEQADPARFVDVNVMGTTAVLDAARRTPSVRRVVHVSSAAVYGAGTGDSGPLTEDTPLLPDEMYGISKVATELIAGRFSTLYDIDVPIVRFTKVFGPMERPSTARAAMSLPFHLADCLLNQHPLLVTQRTPHAQGDWLSAVDIAEALIHLSIASGRQRGTYNLATGHFISAHDLAGLFGVDLQTASQPDTAAYDMDPELRYGKNATYSVKRAHDELGWRPRDLSTQVNEYIQWARQNPSCFTTEPRD